MCGIPYNMAKTKQQIANGVRRDAARRGVTLSKSSVEKLASRRLEQSRVDAAMNPRSKMQHMQGKGGFFGDAYKWMKQKVPKGTFATIGNTLGGPAFGQLGQAIANVTGVGDYTVRRNSIMENEPEKSYSFSNFGGARVRVKKREYIGSVVADATTPEAFAQQQFRLQATNEATFPWASRISQLFTEWQLLGAIVSFESTSSNYSADMALGTVCIGTQYNSNSLPFADMPALLQSAYHTRGNPSETLVHGIECDSELRASERLYTRRPGCEGPPNLYDHGVVTIATEGLPSGSAGATLGRIYITYDLELSLPELPIEPPYGDKIASGVNAAVPSTDPPLGQSLLISEDNSDMSIGTVAGDNVLLLQPATGPTARPVLQPAETNQLCAWINDSTLSVNEQFVTFARAGHYCLQIELINNSSVDPGPGGITIANLSNNTSTTSSSGLFGGGGVYVRAWWFTLEVLTPGTGFRLTNGVPSSTNSVHFRIHAA